MSASKPHSRLPLPWQADQDAGGLWYVWSPGANENNNVVASNMLRADAEFIVGLIEQLEAAQRVVEAAQFYFAEMRAGRPALTIGIEQALDALNPAITHSSDCGDRSGGCTCGATKSDGSPWPVSSPASSQYGHAPGRCPKHGIYEGGVCPACERQ